MKKSIFALFLLTLASQGTWCAAERSTKIDAAHLRPHLQVQELHETEAKKLLEIQSPRELGREHSLTHHEVNTVEKHPRRMAIGHKGGSMGGGGGSGGGTSVGGGGGASVTRPHNTKNGGAVALPVSMTSILTLVFTSAIVLSAFSF